MKIVTLPKKNLQDFYAVLTSFGTLYAPQQRGDREFAFDEVKDFSKIDLTYTRTILPPKKLFLPPQQPLLTFSDEKGYETADDSLFDNIVLFGVRPCDIHGLKILDLIFDGKFVDNYYFARREKVAIIGLDCLPDELCFCRSMGTDYVEDGFDLFFSDVGEGYVVRVGTSLGDDMVLAAGSLFGEMDETVIAQFKRRSRERQQRFSREVKIFDLPEIMDLEYENEIWRELGEKCLSCGSCSMVCPTCYCYDVYDQMYLDGGGGERIRSWDSCLFKEYAQVAGGHNFRGERAARIKNRHIHKQRAFVAEYGRPACTGCGRCIAACPAGIDIRSVIDQLWSGCYD